MEDLHCHRTSGRFTLPKDQWKIYTAKGEIHLDSMRVLFILGGLSLVLAAPQTPYTKPPAKSCHLELTKDKAGNEECFDAEPECNESCKPGEPVSIKASIRRKFEAILSKSRNRN